MEFSIFFYTHIIFWYTLLSTFLSDTLKVSKFLKIYPFDQKWIMFMKNKDNFFSSIYANKVRWERRKNIKKRKIEIGKSKVLNYLSF